MRRNALGFSAPLRKFLAATLASVSCEMPWSWMYWLAFIPKNLVVMNWPFSPYHCGSASLAGSSVNAPRGCLSMPTAMPMSYLPSRIVSAVCWMALAEVAQALNTLVKGMPVRPTSRVTASGLDTSWLPPTPNWMSFHSTPASLERELDGLGAHLHGGLVEPAERVEADADDGDVVHESSSSSSAAAPAERERDDLVAVVVGGERHHGQLDLHAELELLRVVLGQPALDPDDVVELDQADAEGHEVLARRPAYGAPGRKPWVVQATRVPRRGSSTSDMLAGAALGAALLGREGGGPATAARLPMSCGFSSGQVEISGASAFCEVDTGLTIIGNGVLV